MLSKQCYTDVFTSHLKTRSIKKYNLNFKDKCINHHFCVGMSWIRNQHFEILILGADAELSYKEPDGIELR